MGGLGGPLANLSHLLAGLVLRRRRRRVTRSTTCIQLVYKGCREARWQTLLRMTCDAVRLPIRREVRQTDRKTDRQTVSEVSPNERANLY